MHEPKRPERLLFMAQELGGAGHWADTIAVQMGRVLDASWGVDRDATPASNHRLRYEAYFYLAAVRQLLRVCRAYLTETADERLEHGLAAFESAASDAVNFRDWAEHLDAYFAGIGDMQKKGQVAAGATLDIERAGDRVVLHFDGRKLDLLDAAAAAGDLAGIASTVWTEHLAHRMAPGAASLSHSLQPPEDVPR
jgi:hypothetical protein